MNTSVMVSRETEKAAASLVAFMNKCIERGTVVQLHDPEAYAVAHSLVLATVATIRALLDDEPLDDGGKAA